MGFLAKPPTASPRCSFRPLTRALTPAAPTRATRFPCRWPCKNSSAAFCVALEWPPAYESTSTPLRAGCATSIRIPSLHNSDWRHGAEAIIVIVCVCVCVCVLTESLPLFAQLDEHRKTPLAISAQQFVLKQLELTSHFSALFRGGFAAASLACFRARDIARARRLRSRSEESSSASSDAVGGADDGSIAGAAAAARAANTSAGSGAIFKGA